MGVTRGWLHRRTKLGSQGPKTSWAFPMAVYALPTRHSSARHTRNRHCVWGVHAIRPCPWLTKNRDRSVTPDTLRAILTPGLKCHLRPRAHLAHGQLSSDFHRVSE